MASLGDIERKGALRVLAALARAHPQPMDAMTIADVSGADTKTAASLRAALVASALIDDEVVWERGAVQRREVSLTPLGVEIARLCLQIEEALTKAKPKREVKR